jgi:ESF2/ABP1 family protein
VVYVGRVPPKLTVSKLKTLLSDHGEVTRVYLEEEDRAKRKRRKRAGGGGGKRYTEGWAEFSSKHHAKAAARGLHMTSMERKGTHSEDLWSLRYLKGFKWDMLTEKVAYERRVREQKLRVEMAGASRQKKEFEARIEEGERFEAMERRRGKLEMGGGEFKREFRQKKVLED